MSQISFLDFPISFVRWQCQIQCSNWIHEKTTKWKQLVQVNSDFNESNNNFDWKSPHLCKRKDNWEILPKVGEI